MSAVQPKRRRPEKLLLRVIKGGLVPADGYTLGRLRNRGYKIGATVLAELTKPRNPGFHRLAHALGTLIAENIEEFAGMDAHAVLKRLQLEAGVACDEVLAFMDIELMGHKQRIKVNQRIPRSLSFASMEDGEFREVMRALSNYVAREYWPGLTAERIEAMAEAMPEAA